MEALKLFHADTKLVAASSSGSSNPTYTLTPCAPSNPSTGAYLYLEGDAQVSWSTDPSSNYINLAAKSNQNGILEIHLGRVRAGKTYLVTFNVFAGDRTQVTTSTQLFPSNAAVVNGPYQTDSVVEPGALSIPVVVTPGFDTATLIVGKPKGHTFNNIGSFIVEGVTVEQL